MRLSEFLEIINPADRIRIIEGNRSNKDVGMDPDLKILYSGYKSLLSFTEELSFLNEDPEVIRFICSPEIRHKQFKELGLIPPYEPDIARMYEFKDLTVFIYYDIFIKRKE